MNLTCKIQYTVCNVDIAVNTLGSGMRRKEMPTDGCRADDLLGEPIQTAEHRKALRVVTRTSPFGDGRLVAEFVEDVFFRYSMTSE